MDKGGRDEEAQRESEARLAFVLEAAQIGEWELDLDTLEARRSLVHDRIFGYDVPPPAWSYDVFLHEHVLPEDRAAVDRAFRRTLETHEDWDFECRIVRTDGELRWIWARGRLLAAAGDRPARLLGLVQDITERKGSEARDRFLLALNRALQPLEDPDEVMATSARLLCEHLGAARCAYAEVEADEDHLVLTGDAAEGAPRTVERLPMAAFGKEALRLLRAHEPYVVDDARTDPRVGPDDLAAYRRTRVAAMVCVPLHKAERFVAAMVVRQVTPRRWTREEVELIRTVAGRCWESIERARAHRMLRESERRFRALVTASSDAVYRMSPDWSAMRHLQGRELVVDTHERSRSWLDSYIPPDERSRVGEAIDRAVRTKSPFELEHRVLQADGTTGWTLSRAIPLLDEGGAVVEWFGTASDVTERKQAEEALAKLTADADRQRRLYETILSSTPDLVYVFDLDYRFTYVNDALLATWGRSLEASVGKRMLEIGYEPWLAERHERELDRAVATRQPVRGEVPFRHATLGRRIYDYIFVPVLDEAGEVEAIVGTTRDVTDQRRVLEALRDSEQRYRSLFNSMDQGFCVIEVLFDEDDAPVDYRFLETNPVFEQQTGLEDAEGRTVLELVPELEPHWVETYGDVARTGRAIRFSDSSRAMGRWFDLYAFRIGGEESRKVAVLFTDITERKKAEEEREELLRALELERSRLTTVFEKAPAAITTLRGPEHVFEMTNPLYDQLVGHRELIGRRVRDALPEAEEQGFIELLDRVYTTGEPFVGRGVQILLQAEGDDALQERYLDFVYQPLRDSDGSVTGIFVHAVDVTDHKRAAEALERAHDEMERRVAERTADLTALNAELESFNYSVSHDLRAPLRGIDGFSQVLLEDYGDVLDEQARAHLQRIRAGAERMGVLIDDLLTLSRLSRGALERRRVDLSALAESVVESLRTADPGRRAEVIVQPGITATGDEGFLRIVLENLLGNAWKFTSKHDRACIEFGVAESGSERVYRVRDTGAGFDMRYADKLFAPFQRVHSPDDFPGTGIGLAIVQRIVHRHGGRVWAEAEVGGGATFSFTLP